MKQQTSPFGNTMMSPDYAQTMKEMQGEIWRTKGLAIEQLLIGRPIPGDYDDRTMSVLLDGGILRCKLFHPKETSSTPSPDFFSRDPELVGDVIHFEISGSATPAIQEVREKLSEGIRHTLDKITDETLNRLELKNPKIMSMIAFGPEYHPGDLDAITPLINNIMADPGFDPKNRIDALVVCFYPEPLNSHVPRFVVYTRDHNFTDGLFPPNYSIRPYR